MVLMLSKLLPKNTFLRKIFSSSSDREDQELKVYKELSYENFISDETLLPYYLEFLKEEYAEELILFHLEVQKYKSMNLKDRLNQKEKIFCDYIDTKTAKYEITLSFKLKKRITDKKKLQDEEEKAEKDLFDDVERYIVSKPLRETFMRFKTSKIYEQAEKRFS
eukprot:gene10832-3452_t